MALRLLLAHSQVARASRAAGRAAFSQVCKHAPVASAGVPTAVHICSNTYGTRSFSSTAPVAPPADTVAANAQASFPGTQQQTDRMIIMFTCTVCSTRSARMISKLAYYNGAVVVRCPCCKNLHLIADRLGYFDDEHQDVESLARAKGERVRQMTLSGDDMSEVDANTVDLTPDDIAVLRSASKSVNLKTGTEVALAASASDAAAAAAGGSAMPNGAMPASSGATSAAANRDAPDAAIDRR